jgi:hypothetical protein
MRENLRNKKEIEPEPKRRIEINKALKNIALYSAEANNQQMVKRDK